MGKAQYVVLLIASASVLPPTPCKSFSSLTHHCLEGRMGPFDSMIHHLMSLCWIDDGNTYSWASGRFHGTTPIFLVAALHVLVLALERHWRPDGFLCWLPCTVHGRDGVGGLTVRTIFLAEFLPSHRRGLTSH
jgi:hypothetical protein